MLVRARERSLCSIGPNDVCRSKAAAAGNRCKLSAASSIDRGAYRARKAEIKLIGSSLRYLQLRAGVIDKHPLAGDMRLAHRRRDALLPGPVQVAKTRVRVPAGMLLAILLPEQLQRDARPLQLAMDLRPIR